MVHAAMFLHVSKKGDHPISNRPEALNLTRRQLGRSDRRRPEFSSFAIKATASPLHDSIEQSIDFR